MKKRLIALSLALVLLLSILPVTVYAKYEEVDRVYLEGFCLPLIGQTPAENLSGFHVYEDNGLTLMEYQWYEYIGAGSFELLADDAKFEENVMYKLHATLQLQSGYVFSSDVDASLDGHYDISTKCSVSGNTFIFDTYLIQPCTPIEAPVICGFTEPKAGQTPAELQANIIIPEDAKCEISTYKWYDCLINNYVSETEAFKEGHTYFYTCTLTPKEGYAFLVPKPASYSVDSLEYQVTDNDCYICSRNIRLPVPDNILCDVAIDGYTFPAVGQTVADNLKSITASNANHYSMTDVYWMRDVDGELKEMNRTDKFVENEGYVLQAKFKADSGYTFFDTLYGKVNGSERFGEYSFGVGDDAFLTVREVYASAPNEITGVDISGYQAPKMGQSVEENLKNLKITTNHVQIVDIHWTRYDGAFTYSDMTGSDVFTDEYFYQLEFEVATGTGYQFYVYANINVSGDVCGECMGEVYGENNEHFSFAIFPYALEGVDDCENDTQYCPSRNFTDVPAYSEWSHKGIDYVLSRGLFNGTSANTFSPKDTMTRAMLVTVLWRYEGAPKGFTSAFSDVPTGEWYTDAVAWANAKNIVNGVGENKFDPNGTITREQMAAILHRYATAKGFDTSASADLSAYPDVGNVGDWSVDAMKWAVGAGMITGSAGADGKVCLMPGNGATREQVAAILMRFINNIAEK